MTPPKKKKFRKLKNRYAKSSTITVSKIAKRDETSTPGKQSLLCFWNNLSYVSETKRWNNLSYYHAYTSMDISETKLLWFEDVWDSKNKGRPGLLFLPNYQESPVVYAW